MCITCVDEDVSLFFHEDGAEWLRRYLEDTGAVIVLPHAWRPVQVAEQLDFDASGIVAAHSAPLTRAGLPLLYISTFTTDFNLVREEDIEVAVDALSKHFRVLTDVVVPLQPAAPPPPRTGTAVAATSAMHKSLSSSLLQRVAES